MLKRKLAASSSVTNTNGPVLSALNKHTIDSFRNVINASGEPILLKIIDHYLELAKLAITNLEQSYEKQDFEKFIKILDSWRASTFNIGALGFSDFLLKTKKMCLENSANISEGILSDIKSKHKVVIKALRVEEKLLIFKKNAETSDFTAQNALQKEKIDNRYNVFLINCNPILQSIIHEVFSRSNYSLHISNDTENAIKKITNVRPDFFILDIGVSELEGIENCREIRSLQEYKNTPILMLTGYMDNYSINDACEAGATDFFPRPIDWNLFIYRIQYMLNNHSISSRLQESQTRLESAQHIARIGDWSWDVEKDYFTCSNEIIRLYGFSSNDMPISHDSILKKIASSNKDQYLSEINKLREKNGVSDIVYEISGSGSYFGIIRSHVRSICDHSGNVIKLVGVAQDITKQFHDEEKIKNLAYYDSLTQIPNRIMFRQNLLKTLVIADKHNKKVAVMFIDLDGFKRINDSLGHTVGDQLLIQVSKRISNSVRKSDYMSALGLDQLARFGGDEFVVILENLEQPDEAGFIAQRIIENLHSHFEVENHNINITSSIGIAIYPEDANNAEDLLKNADLAMYEAKRSGKGMLSFFTPDMHEAVLSNITLDSEIRQALHNNEFEIYYQPIFDWKSKKINQIEALLRWPASNKPIPASKLISTAEETTLIHEIDFWVIENVIRQVKAWGLSAKAIKTVSINISAKEFDQPEFATKLLGLINKYSFDPNILELEITESAITVNPENTIKQLDELAESGIRIAIDDFGKGYTSLSHFKYLQVDTIKIDRSFIANLPEDMNDATITQAIIDMGTRLGLKVVGEGIETKSQLEFLLHHNCFNFQGYLIGYAVPGDQILHLISNFILDENLSILTIN